MWEQRGGLGEVQIERGKISKRKISRCEVTIKKSHQLQQEDTRGKKDRNQEGKKGGSEEGWEEG